MSSRWQPQANLRKRRDPNFLRKGDALNVMPGMTYRPAREATLTLKPVEFIIVVKTRPFRGGLSLSGTRPRRKRGTQFG
jgi:hypothetical protein